MKESDCAEASSSSFSSFMGGKKRKRVEDGKSEACPCTECGKKFWSPKALYGHMRCHPEREWRGINPPPNVKRQKRQPIMMTLEDHEVAACLLLLANGNAKVTTTTTTNKDKEEFECSSCNKVFGSHQALGGHRASHKNVRGCFANACSDSDDTNTNNVMMGNSSSTPDGHKCSICLRVFSTGQALGGHKRCHWEKGDKLVDLNLPPPLDPSSSPPLSLDLRLGL